MVRPRPDRALFHTRFRNETPLAISCRGIFHTRLFCARRSHWSITKCSMRPGEPLPKASRSVWRQNRHHAPSQVSTSSVDIMQFNCLDVPSGRSRKQKIVIGNDFVHERLAVNGRDYIYKQVRHFNLSSVEKGASKKVEGCFTQPNGAVCAHMLSWAQTASNPKTSPPANDLLELYCGNCNFTIPLAQSFRHVIATEVSRAAVQAGKQNLETNHVDNVLLVRPMKERHLEKVHANRHACPVRNL